MVERDSTVTLRIVDGENVRAVIDLSATEEQQAFVAANVFSLAQAFATTNVWVRAVYADNTPVGFVMLTDDERTQRYFLWRFMIDERYQRMGFGRSAMNLIHEYVGTRPGGTKVYLSFVPADGVQGRSTRVSVTSKRAKWKMANSRLCSTSHVDQRAH